MEAVDIWWIENFNTKHLAWSESSGGVPPTVAKSPRYLQAIQRAEMGDVARLFLRKTVSDSHFPPNQKQKYIGHRTNELAATDFLFDFVYRVRQNKVAP